MSAPESFLDVAVNEVDKEQPEWVVQRLGKNVISRVTATGRSTMDYLEDLNMSQSEDKKREFTGYMHKFGKDAMQLQKYDSSADDARRAVLLKQMARAGRILRKHVRVSENEAGQSSVEIDKDWNTSSWSAEMIEAGMDALFYIFLDDANPDNDVKKPQAVVMLQKLLQRHTEAETYIKFKLDDLMTQALNSFMKAGKCRARLDMIYLIYVSKDKFIGDISMFSFAGRAAELLAAEARLAAILIQHFFRVCKTAKANSRAALADAHKRSAVSNSFGTEEEMLHMRKRAAQLRTIDLRNLWRDMHAHMRRAERQTIGGFRGPAHIPFQYVLLLLEIILTIVSKGAGKYAASNRDDFVLANGCIILASTIASTTSKFAYPSLHVLANVAKVSASWRPLLECGCVRAALRFLHFLRDTGKLYWLQKGSDGLHLMRDKSMEEQALHQVHKFAFFDAILFLSKLATHSAGVFRARGGYGFLRPARGGGDSEAIDYLAVLGDASGHVPGSAVEALLGDRKLTGLLVQLTIECRHLHAMRSLLLCLFSLACSECHKPLLLDLVADSGRAMAHVLELLNERDASTSSLAMCLMLQLATLGMGRDTLITSEVGPMLARLTRRPADGNFTRRPYQRAILITASMLRQRDWRAYDPEDLPSFLTDSENVRRAVYLDLLKTIKQPPLADADALTISDLCVLPANPEATLDMSRVAEDLNPRDVADFLVRPGSPKYIESLAWEEATGGCIFLWGLTRSCGTAEHLVSQPIIYYLGQYMYISRYVLEQAKLSNNEVLVLCNGLHAAAAALERICFVATGSSVREDAFLEALFAVPGHIEAFGYFVNTLALEHRGMDETSLDRLREASLALLDFLFRLVDLVLHMQHDVDRRTARLLALAGLGKTASGVVRHLSTVYVGRSDLLYTVLDKTCKFYAALVANERCAADAASNWGIFEALRAHLPVPLFGIGAPTDAVYQQELTKMPASLVTLLANLCQADRGRGYVLADGFLRRCLDKVHFMHPMLESSAALGQWGRSLQARPPNRWPEEREWHASPTRAMVCACMRLFARCINFGSSQYGSCNDLILHPNYNLPPICRDIVDKDACPRADPCYLATLVVLACFAKDMVRMDAVFQEIDVVALIRRQLDRVGELPPAALSSCLETLQAVAGGNTSEYKKQQFFQLREPLGRVAMAQPSFESKVAQVKWGMFLSAEKAEMAATRLAQALGGRSVPVSSAARWNGDSFDFDNDELLSEQLQKLYLKAGLTEESNALSSRATSRGSSRASSRGTGSASAAGSRAGSRRGSFAADPATHDDVQPGTYDACGVSHCGPLRLGVVGAGDGRGPVEHGMSRPTSGGAPPDRLLHLPQFDATGNAAVSKLSAREPELQSLLLHRKQLSGFVAKVMSPIRQQQQRSPSSHKAGAKPKSILKKPPGSPAKKLAPLPVPGVATVDLSQVPELLRTRPRPEEPLIFIC